LYEWLRDYQKLEEDIAYLEFNLEQTKRELKRWVEGDLSDVRLTQNSLGSKVEEVLERIRMDLKFKREQKLNLMQLVDKFKGLDNKILKMKYVDGMTLDNIAHELGYSTSHIYKKHAEIIRMIKFAGELSLDCR
jgi:DNA-directed RNA polymerase specialized sigma subunit